jgi:hypothetical protein
VQVGSPAARSNVRYVPVELSLITIGYREVKRPGDNGTGQRNNKLTPASQNVKCTP